VIAELENAGPDSPKLNDLRATAPKSRDAMYAGDFCALGQAMIENTEAQGRLHADMISGDAQQVIQVARKHGALGWKVNGAGGEGGSVTILCGESSYGRRAMLQEIEETSRLFQTIPVYLSQFGLRVWPGSPLALDGRKRSYH